jgi:hypothetical protein
MLDNLDTTYYYYGSIGFLALSIYAIYSIRRSKIQSIKCKNWPSAPMTFNKLELLEENGKHGFRKFKLNVLYSYTYEQHDYQSSVIAFYFPESGMNGDLFKRTHEKIKDLKMAYINPADPKMAVLLNDNARLFPVPFWILYGMCLLCPQCGWLAIYVIFINKNALGFPG